MAHYEIRPAAWQDFPGVWALERACFGRDAWGPLEITYTLLVGTVRLKIVADDRLVGFAVGEAHRREGEGWITTLGIHPEYQRRGLGKDLLARTEALLSQPVLKLTVRASNAPAIALYRQAGYMPVERIARYYAGGEDGLVMEKRWATPRVG